MSNRPGSSAQVEWCNQPTFSLRRSFPGFTALWDCLQGALAAINRFVAIERNALVVTAVALAALTFVSSYVAVLFDPQLAKWIRFVEIVPLVAVALAGAWSSVGGGAWHFRISAAALAAFWFAAVHLSLVNDFGISMWYSEITFTTAAAGAFALAAFGAAWIRSLTGKELRGLPTPPAVRLARRQFRLRTLMLAMLAVGVGLGTLQMMRRLGGSLELDLNRMLRREVIELVVPACGAVLLSFIVGFRRWPVVLLGAAAGIVALLAWNRFIGAAPRRGVPFLPLVALRQAATSAGGISLFLAMLVVLWLRRCRFAWRPEFNLRAGETQNSPIDSPSSI